MSFVAIEALAVRVTGTRQSLKLRNAALGIVTAREFLEIFADQLVEAFAKSFRPFSGTFDGLLVNG